MLYAHQWLPIPAVVAALLILCAPYLALIALVAIVFVALAMLVALGGAIVAGLHGLGSVELPIRGSASQRRAALANVRPHDTPPIIYGRRGE